MTLDGSADDLLDQVPALVYAREHDAPWTLHRVSAGGAALLGRSPADLGPGSSLLAAVHPDDRAHAQAAIDGALADAVAYAVEYRLAPSHEGTARWVLDRGQRRGATLVGVIVELEPTRAAAGARRAELDARIAEAHKLEAVGRLAGGIAHEFNNTLTGILGHAARLRATLTADESAGHAAATIEAAARRAAALTDRLLGFACKGKIRNVVFDLVTVVEDALGELAPSLPATARLIGPAEVALAVRGDPAQVQSVVRDLVTNAAEALAADGGVITVSAERVDLEGADAAQHVGAQRGAYVRVSVIDDGAGLSEVHRALAFEPFFSTKPQRAGMGLPMVYGVVKNHGGFVELHSRAGQGTTVAVYLPLVLAQRTSDSVELPVLGPAARARILFVDDEELVRYAARAQIVGIGHSVVLARDGEEAVALFRDKAAEIDLVILDLTMPRMGGADCLRALRAIAPSVRVILSTGFGRDGVVQAVLDLGVSGFLEKPYRQAELAAAIGAALASER